MINKKQTIVINTKKIENVVCPGGGAECPAGTTCCELGDGEYGCCPLENAVVSIIY